jgi:hypothetical protein
MAAKPVIIKRKLSTSGYDTFYPKTTVEQVDGLASELSSVYNAIDDKAPLDSPTFTGNTTVNGRLIVSNNTATITANTTLSAVHRGATIFCKNSTAITITVPLDGSNSTFPPGTEITLIRRGAGTVTIATTNISLFSVGSGTANAGRRAIANQNEGVILIKETGNTWQLIGAL